MDTNKKTKKPAVVNDYGKYVGSRLLLGSNAPRIPLLIGGAYVQPIEADIIAISATGKWVKIERVATKKQEWRQVGDYEILDLIS